MATQVPYTGAPTERPNLSPTPTVAVNAPVEAFGGATARATERAGATGEAVGNELYSRAIAMQELDQQAKAANAVASFTDKVGDLDVEYRSKEGKAAVDGYPGYKDQIDKIRQDVGSGLDSPYSQRIFLQESRNIQSRAVIGAGIHAGEQFKKYQIGTSQATMDAGEKLVSSNPEDEDLYRQQLKVNTGESAHQQQLHGMDDAWRQDFETKANSKLVASRVEAMVLKDSGAAERMLGDAVKAGEIDGETAGKVGRYVRSQVNNVTARVESANLLDGKGALLGKDKVSPDVLFKSIVGVESSGDYNAKHQDVTHKVNGVMITEHGLGIGGVMQSNLQPWLQEARNAGVDLPAKMTEQQYLTDHDAQDKLVKFKLNQYQDQYGSANAAAQHWRGLAKKDLASGQTEDQYIHEFNSKLAKNLGPDTIGAAAESRAKEISPDNSELHQIMRDHTINEWHRGQAVVRAERIGFMNSVFDAMKPDETGKVPTSLQDIKDPAALDAYHRLEPKDQRVFDKDLDTNARSGGYRLTAANAPVYNQIKGALNDPTATDDERKQALETDIYKLPLPWKERNELIAYQKKDLTQMDRNPVLAGAIETLRPTLDAMHIGTKEDVGKKQYHEFIGKLQSVIAERQEQTKQPIKPEEIKALGAGMLRTFATPTWFGFSHKDTPEFQRKEYPQNVIDETVKKYVATNGFAPSPQTLDQLITAANINKLYSNQTEKAKGQ